MLAVPVTETMSIPAAVFVKGCGSLSEASFSMNDSVYVPGRRLLIKKVPGLFTSWLLAFAVDIDDSGNPDESCVKRGKELKVAVKVSCEVSVESLPSKAVLNEMMRLYEEIVFPPITDASVMVWLMPWVFA